jgi:hypothetical protein
MVAVVFACTGDYAVNGDGYVSCAGSWTATAIPDPVTIASIDPGVWWSHFAVGFVIMGSCWFTGRLVRYVLQAIK